MALNFPDSPSVNEKYTDSTSGFTYTWDGTVWKSIGISTTRISNIRELDDISSGFDCSETNFTMAVSGTQVEPVTNQQILISVGGVMQNPGQDFYVNGTSLVFTTAPISGLTFFGILYGTDLTLNTVADGSITVAKLSTGAPAWDASGNTTISGVSTISGAATISGAVSLEDSISLLDNKKINIGTGNDLEIYHDSNNSIINDAGTGDIKIQIGGSDKIVTNSDGIIVTGVTTSGGVTLSSGAFTGSGTGISGVTTTFYTAVGIQSTGTAIGVGVTQLNFIGAGNTFAYNSSTDTVDISIAGGGGGGGSNATASYFASGWGGRTVTNYS